MQSVEANSKTWESVAHCNKQQYLKVCSKYIIPVNPKTQVSRYCLLITVSLDLFNDLYNNVCATEALTVYLTFYSAQCAAFYGLA